MVLVTQQGHSGDADGATPTPTVARPTPVRRGPLISALLAVALSGGAVVVLTTSAGAHPADLYASTPVARHAAPAVARTTPASHSSTSQATRHAPLARAATSHVPRAATASPRSAPTSATPTHSASSTVSVTLALPANVPPTPDFLSAGGAALSGAVLTYDNPCVTASGAWPVLATGDACTQFVLAAIDHARALEGVRPMVLPSNWSSLTVGQQLFVVADLERVDRGLPPYLGLNGALGSAAQSAATSNAGPGTAHGGVPLRVVGDREARRE